MKNFFEGKDNEKSEIALGKGYNFSAIIRKALSEIGITRKVNITNHLLFQSLLNVYEGEGKSLQTFLRANGYEVVGHFQNQESFVSYVKSHPEIISEIHHQTLHMAFVYNDLSPVHIVLGKIFDSPENVRERVAKLVQKACDSSDLSNITL